MHHANGSDYFTHDEEMIARGSILSGITLVVSDPEAIGPFISSFITDRALIWYKMITIFQGKYAWTYMKPSKKNNDGRMGYKLIYNHYLGPRITYHIEAGAEKKLAQFTHTV